MSDVKRFDDYTEVVHCNECSHYWDSSCDGVCKGAEAYCTSYVATRNVVIPEKVNALEKRVNRLYIACYGLLLFSIIAWVVIFSG
jgi:hypothetical protein